MPRPRWEHHLHVLRQSLGGSTAAKELRWMRNAVRERGLAETEAASILDAMVHQRAKGHPLAYVIGDQPFGPLRLLCRPPTLIPRPETEDWVYKLADTAKLRFSGRRNIDVLDVCTGTGCIPLLLSRLLQPQLDVQATGVDISEDALSLARENAALNNAPTGACRSTFISADLFASSFSQTVKGPFDILTCNPPYIPMHEYEGLSPSVRDHEDVRALVGDVGGETDGLSFYRRLTRVIRAGKVLGKGAIIAVEHGAGQSEAVQDIFRTSFGDKLEDLQSWEDQWNLKRSVVAFM